MKIKICGLRERSNIEQIAALKPDILGFIFYKKSKRYVGDAFQIPDLPDFIQKAGVFVNEDISSLLAIAAEQHLQIIQLHGEESNEYCRIVRSNGYLVIKAISVDEKSRLSALRTYKDSIDYFLFDTATIEYGGSGKVFNWHLLSAYNLNIPFFLSGGLGMNNLPEIKAYSHPQLAGVDANSQLEINPGNKNIAITSSFIQSLRHDSL